MGTLDFAAARFSHLNWKFKLQAFIGGSNGVKEEVFTDHHECDLGKWLYHYGLERYKHLDEIKELEKVHKELHLKIKEVLQVSRTQGMQEANKIMREKIEPMTNQIIGILNILEAKVNM